MAHVKTAGNLLQIMCLAGAWGEWWPKFWPRLRLGGRIFRQLRRASDRSLRIIHTPKIGQEIEQCFVVPSGHFRFSNKGLVARKVSDNLEKPKETGPRGMVAG
jgi:hypothetical protein